MCDLMKHEILASTLCTGWDQILQSVDMFVKLLESCVVLSAYILVWVAPVGIQPPIYSSAVAGRCFSVSSFITHSALMTLLQRGVSVLTGEQV